MRLRRYSWRGWLAAILMMAAPVVAQSTVNLSFPRSDEEPITPIQLINGLDPQKIALGELLFKDPRLSQSGTVSCSSCHDLSTNGADFHTLDPSPGRSKMEFNTPTVFNAALNFRLNWEGNFRTLESHTEALLEATSRMDQDSGAILDKLNNDPQMHHLFVEAYGRQPDQAAIVDAISMFERSLLTPDSRFDRWLTGDASALSQEELSGYALFKSLGCVSCHQGENIGGNLFQRHGIFHPLASPTPEILRVPSLRNVATTAPYFHDGSAATLDDAVRKMASAQLNRNLSDEQVKLLVAFLHTLTGTYRGKSVVAAHP